MKRNCSNQEAFLREAGELRKRLLMRGYSHTCLKKAFKRANNQVRQDLLFSKKKTDTAQATQIITKYNKHKTIRKIIEKFWHLLRIDPTLNTVISETPAIT